MMGIAKKRRNSLKGLGLLLVLATFLFSCGKSPYYNTSYAFENQTWSQDLMPKFEVDIQDTSQLYDFEIFLRNTTDYAHSNLFIYLQSFAPDGSNGRKAYEIPIADEKGQWLGTKSGTLVENVLKFKQRKFPLKGKYTFKIELGITEKEMKNISDIGLRITAL